MLGSGSGSNTIMLKSCFTTWYLQRLKSNAKDNNIVVFTMFPKYSWYLQRLKDDASGILQANIKGDWASPGQNFDSMVSFWWVLGIVQTWYPVGNTCCAITTWCYARQCPWRKGGLWILFSGDNSFPFREICLQQRIQTLHSSNPG